jgi:sugar (pentulose or hexulose) kinase
MTAPGADAWLGIDLGTQGVRVLVVTSEGSILGEGSAPLTSHRDGDRHEQDPNDWWRAVCEAIGKAGTDGADLAAVRGLAVDATSGTVTLLDRTGAVATPALMYDDGRAAGELARVNEAGAAQWTEAGYQRMQRSWGLPKFRWLLDRYPNAAREGWTLAHQNDVINRRLVGHEVPTDTSNALKTGADAAAITWPESAFAALDIPREMLPDLVLPGTELGGVCAAAAAATGLAEGTPVIAGMTDGCAAQLGSGATAIGSWNSVMGTTLVLKGVTQQPVRDPNGVVYSHRSPSGHWLPGGASSVGAGLVAREFGDADLARLTKAAASLLPTDLIRYPLVSPGERFPFVAPAATEFSTRAAASAEESFAALLQGVAYVERLCFDYLDHLGAPTDGVLVLTGGATRNQLWNQLRADVLHRSVSLPRNAQPALGMAVLAASTATELETATTAMVHLDRTIEPRSEAPEAYEEGYLRLLDELVQRGWLAADVAAHAQERISR